MGVAICRSESENITVGREIQHGVQVASRNKPQISSESQGNKAREAEVVTSRPTTIVQQEDWVQQHSEVSGVRIGGGIAVAAVVAAAAAAAALNQGLKRKNDRHVEKGMTVEREKARIEFGPSGG